MGAGWGTALGGLGVGWPAVANRYIFRAAVVGGLTGILTGGLVTRHGVSEGVMSTVNAATWWGAGLGWAAGRVAGLRQKGLVAVTLVAGNAGVTCRHPGWQGMEPDL